jgi:T-complex protein 1 subunit gamma
VSSSWVRTCSLRSCPAHLAHRVLTFIQFITAGEILAHSLPLLQRNIHPVVIISAFKKALAHSLETVSSISRPVDVSSDPEMLALIKTSIGTKFSSRWSDLMCQLALDAVRTVSQSDADGIKTVDIKRYARVEKVPGGEIEDSKVLDGVMVNKDVTHPKMRRRIENPRVVLLDCPLEYKKGESQTNIEITREEDWSRVLEIEEEQIKQMCDRLIEFKPDLIFTEKGVSGLSFLLSLLSACQATCVSEELTTPLLSHDRSRSALPP